ncbi:MAG TPA: PilZ domain-containing protein [Salinarimonas sp.]|jgi:hypothetical protein|nr:PilZ domain-containing protein [Salinarimonas sp.]
MDALADPVRPRLRIADKRRFARVAVALLGRYMLPDRQEYPCQTVNLSPGGALVTAPVRGNVGDRVVVYLEHLGRLEGEVTRLVANGFAFSIAATPRKRDKLASQLTWLANRHALGLPEDRRHERIVPRNPLVEMRIENGRPSTVRLIDLSLSGAGVALEVKPPLGTAISLGRTPCRVVRHFQGGVAVEFLLPLSPDRFDESIVL